MSSHFSVTARSHYIAIALLRYSTEYGAKSVSQSHSVKYTIFGNADKINLKINPILVHN